MMLSRVSNRVSPPLSPRFGASKQATSLEKRQEVFELLETHAKDAAQKLWSNRGNDTSNRSGNVALAGFLQAYATMAGYMVQPEKPPEKTPFMP